MNEELQKAVTELITGTLDTAGAAKDFILAETPEYIQQLLMWKAAHSFLIFAVCVVILGLIVRQHKKLFSYKAMKKEDRPEWVNCIYSESTSVDYDFMLIAMFVPSGVCLIVALNSLTWLKIWLAPKVFLVEYAASLVK